MQFFSLNVGKTNFNTNELCTFSVLLRPFRPSLLELLLLLLPLQPVPLLLLPNVGETSFHADELCTFFVWLRPTGQVFVPEFLKNK